jgi:tripartite-type tricarboxylate transporter receptor subunit TctC
MTPRIVILAAQAATVAALAATVAALAATSSLAQDFPNKPVQLMVAYPPGGSTDIGARIVASIAEKMLGQPIIVVNKGGAGGQVGWTEGAKNRPGR